MSEDNKDINPPIPALDLSRPRGAALPFVFSFPHSGDYYPDCIKALSNMSEAQLRSSEDAYVHELFKDVGQYGATTIKANYARAYLDLNRRPEELDSTMFDAPLERMVSRTPMVKAGLGVIPRNVSNMIPIYSKRLEAAEADRRLSTVYFPYHKALSDEIDTLWRTHGTCYVIDCHSMPSIPERQSRKFGKTPKLADIVLGDRWGGSCDGNLSHLIEELLRKQGLSVARNVPYAGGNITKRYGHPIKGVHALQIEICRDLYMNEETIERNDNFKNLQNILNSVAERTIEILSPDMAEAAE